MIHPDHKRPTNIPIMIAHHDPLLLMLLLLIDKHHISLAIMSLDTFTGPMPGGPIASPWLLIHHCANVSQVFHCPMLMPAIGLWISLHLLRVPYLE